MAVKGIKIVIRADVREAEKAQKALEQQAGKVKSLEADYAKLKKEYDAMGNAAGKAAKEVDAAFSKLRAAQAKQVSIAAGIKGQFNLGRGIDTSEAYQNALQRNPEYQKAAAEADRLNESLRQLHETMSQSEVAHGELGDKVKDTENSLSAERQELGRLSEKSKEASQKVSRFDRAVSGAKKAAVTAVKGLAAFGRGLVSLGGKIKSVVSRLGLFRRESQRSQGATNGFSRAIIKLGTMLKMAILRKAIHGIVNGAREGFENLAQYSTDCNGNISALMSSLTRLKNSFAAAFAPVLSIVRPILTGLINQLSQAVTYIGAFFSALSGAKTFVKATAVTENYAKTLKATGSAAKEAKKSLAGFDTLEVLDNGDTSGGSGTVLPSEMFEEVEIPSFIQKLKDMITSKDWDGLGAAIAGGINSGLSKLGALISWDNVGPAITDIVSGITETLNSLVSNIDWDLMGQTIGTGVNTLVNTLFMLFTGIDWFHIGSALATGLNAMITTIDWGKVGATIGAFFTVALNTMLGFVQTFDWAAAGAALGTALQGIVDFVDWNNLGALLAGAWNGAISFIRSATQAFDWVGFATDLANGANTLISSVDWAETGRTVGDFFTSVLSFLSTAIETFDWFGLGQSIMTFLVNIDWGGIASGVAETVGAAIGGFFALVLGFISDAWNGLVTWWQDTAFKDGKFTIEGLLNGIWDGICNIGIWIYDHIFKPFIDGFKKAFGIHSPSTVMAEMGSFLVEGLKNGLTGLWDKVKGFFTDAVNGIRDTFSLDNLKSIGSNAVKGLINGLKSVGSKVVSWGSGILGNIKDSLGIHSPSTETEEVGEYTVSGYIIGLDAYGDKLNAALARISDAVLGVFRAVAETVLARQEAAQAGFIALMASWTAAVKEAFAAFYADLVEQAGNWASGLQSTLERMVSSARSAAGEITAALASVQAPEAFTVTAARVNTAQAMPAYATGTVLPASNSSFSIANARRGKTEAMLQAAATMNAGDNGISAIIPELREILGAIREGKVIMVDKTVLGSIAQETLMASSRIKGFEPITVR